MEQSIFAAIAEFCNLSVSSWLYVYIYFSVPSVPTVPGIQISYNELINLTSLYLTGEENRVEQLEQLEQLEMWLGSRPDWLKSGENGIR